MTAKITQNITKRHSAFSNKRWYLSPNGGWRQNMRSNKWERGSISSTTITLGLSISVILVVAGLSFFYLGQVLNTASKGTDIHDIEERISELKERQHVLELEGAHLRSIQAIEQKIPDLNLVKTDNVSYLNQGTEKVAVLSE
jgi:hypothetical protein